MIKILGFISDHWAEIVAIVTAIYTLWQEVRKKFFEK